MTRAKRVQRIKAAASPDKPKRKNSHSKKSRKAANTSDKVGEGQLKTALQAFDWYHEYEQLCHEFDWKKAAYIAWAASPAKTRRPATQPELATALGYKSDRTFRDWKAKNPDIDQAIKRIQASPIVTHRRDIYNALVDSALLAGAQGFADRKLALELLGDLDDKPAGGEVAQDWWKAMEDE